MKLKQLIVSAAVVAALASSSLAAAAEAPEVPQLKVGPSLVKVQSGKIVLTATCVGEDRCQSVLTASIAVRNGGLGGKFFRVEPGETSKLVFSLRPEVRTWLKTHRRSTLVISARTSNDDYEVVWRGTFRLRLAA
jgi:hypothetical protein